MPRPSGAPFKNVCAVNAPPICHVVMLAFMHDCLCLLCAAKLQLTERLTPTNRSPLSARRDPDVTHFFPCVLTGGGCRYVSHFPLVGRHMVWLSRCVVTWWCVAAPHDGPQPSRCPPRSGKTQHSLPPPEGDRASKISTRVLLQCIFSTRVLSVMLIG